MAEVILAEMLRRERTERLLLVEALITAQLLSAPKELLSSRFYKHIHKILAENIFQTNLAPEVDKKVLEKVEALGANHR